MRNIKKKILANKQKVIDLLNQNIDLNYQLDIQSATRFSESVEDMGTKQAPVKLTVKWMHWYELFVDEDNPGKPVKVERKKPIEIDGQKSNGWNRLTYHCL